MDLCLVTRLITFCGFDVVVPYYLAIFAIGTEKFCLCQTI